MNEGGFTMLSIFQSRTNQIWIILVTVGIFSLSPILAQTARAAEEWKLGNILPEGNILTEEAKFLNQKFSEATNKRSRDVTEQRKSLFNNDRTQY